MLFCAHRIRENFVSRHRSKADLIAAICNITFPTRSNSPCAFTRAYLIWVYSSFNSKGITLNEKQPIVFRTRWVKLTTHSCKWMSKCFALPKKSWNTVVYVPCLSKLNSNGQLNTPSATWSANQTNQVLTNVCFGMAAFLNVYSSPHSMAKELTQRLFRHPLFSIVPSQQTFLKKKLLANWKVSRSARS